MTKYAPVDDLSPDRCEILASLIEQQPHTTFSAPAGFNMSRAKHACGTPCCIGGWANSLLGSDDRDYVTDIERFLGCNYMVAIWLFSGEFSDKRLGDITPQEAAAAIRALVEKRKERAMNSASSENCAAEHAGEYAPITEFSAERCEILAQTIERQPHAARSDYRGFNMLLPAHYCGSPSCIAGWAGSLLQTDSCGWGRSDIRNFLGCTSNEAGWLFWGQFSEKALVAITPKEAAAAIRSLVEDRKGQSQ